MIYYYYYSSDQVLVVPAFSYPNGVEPAPISSVIRVTTIFQNTFGTKVGLYELDS